LVLAVDVVVDGEDVEELSVALEVLSLFAGVDEVDEVEAAVVEEVPLLSPRESVR
jgi:hypothetical protein